MGLSAARRILWCLRYGIGDLVMQMPALDALRRHCPGAHLTAVGARPAIELLEGDPRVDRLLDVAGFGITHWGDYGDEASRAAMREWVIAGGFDTALDPSHAALGFGLAVWAAQLPCTYDTGNGLENGLVASGLSGLAALRAAVREGWGVPIAADALPRLDPPAADGAWAAETLGGGDWVALSPVASSPLKQWPLERLADLAGRLDRQGWRVLLLAGDCRELPAAAPWRVLGPVPLKRTAALLARCRLFVGNDTGLMHLAAAVGTAVITVFGPTHPRVYLPPGGRALAAEVPCAHRYTDRFGPPPCVVDGRCRIGLRSCIDGIATEAVTALLETGTGGPADDR